MRKHGLLFERFVYRALRPGLFVALLACFALGTVSAVTPETEKDAAATGEGDDDKEADVDFLQLADGFRKHCVRVYIQGQSSDGDAPSVGDIAEDIKHERPSSLGGYWWDAEHVIVPDVGLQDRFIRFVEVGVPGSDKRYPAAVAGRFVALQGVLLEVGADEDGNRPEAAPLEFIDGDIDEAYLLAYAWEDGAWRIKADTGLGAMTVSDDGVEMVALAKQGVFVDEEGRPLGLAFGDSVVVEDETSDAISSWRGAELPYTPFLSAADTDTADADMKKRLADAVLECRFRIRIKVDDDEEDELNVWMNDNEDEHGRDGSAEVRAAGFVVGKRHLLVPLSLPGAGIRKIEAIDVLFADGREIGATFTGAFRDYMAVVVEVDEDLPTDTLPAGLTALNPMDTAPVPSHPWPAREYIRRWRVDYTLGRRRERADYDRWLGTFRGFRGDTVVRTKTDEEDGHLAFDVDGRLAAIALTPRLINSRDRVRGKVLKAAPGFRPLDFIAARLRAPDAFDPAMVPVDEEQGQRLIDLGVEFQSLDANTARLFNASRETRAGKIGVMVSHVYPGSVADTLGLREKDILVRLYIEGRNEPMELRSSGFSYGFDMDMSSESFRRILRYLPAPWPSRDNVVSTLLTGAGVGRKATVEYVRDGELRRAEFVTAYGEPDYRSVRKEKFKALGLTAKPITFEVARYFGRKDHSGVVISHVERGGRSSVAGLHHYLLITHVNGERVEDLDDFKTKLRPFEDGEAASVELTVEDFGKTRLVKIE